MDLKPKWVCIRSSWGAQMMQVNWNSDLPETCYISQVDMKPSCEQTDLSFWCEMAFQNKSEWYCGMAVMKCVCAENVR